MKNKIALSAGLVILTGLGLAFADTAVKTAVPAPSVKQEEGKVREFKDILFRLVRQDDYLDEALETLDSHRCDGNSSLRGGSLTLACDGPAGLEDLAALNVSLKAIAKNLKHISTLNKTEFSSIQAGSNLSNYTNTILSYSRKVNRKAGRVNVLVAQLAARNKKASMRDAVTSAKGGKPAKQSGGSASGGKARGKNLTQLLNEKQAVEELAAAAKTLGAASRDLTATSKWLYIASQ